MTEEPESHYALFGRYLVPAESGPVCDNPACAYHHMTIVDRDVPQVFLTFPKASGIADISLNRYLYLPGYDTPFILTRGTTNAPERMWLCAGCSTECPRVALENIRLARSKAVGEPPKLTKD